MNVRVIAVPLLVASAALMSSPATAQLSLGNLIVTVTAPQAGATVGGTVPVAANVAIFGGLTVQSVEFRVNGVPIGQDTTAPYSIQWDTRSAGNGTRRVSAAARDVLGLTYESADVTVTVFNDLTPPVVAIASPAAGASVSGNVAVAATASDNVAVAGVRFTLDGAPLGAEDTSSPYGVMWNTTSASDGTHTLAAIARDAAGNVTTATAVTVTVDNAPPSAAISSPAANAMLGGAVTIAAAASDSSGIAGVQFAIDGVPLGAEDTSAPYSAVWDSAAVSDGPHSITAVARDNAGKTTVSAAVPVRVDNTPPTVAITAPAGGTTVGDTITISATASDSSGIAGVQFMIDGAPLGAEDTSAPYSAVWDTAAVSDGLHSIAAVARDSAGKTTVSAAVSVRVDTTPPVVAITAPVGGTVVGGTITISADASDSGGIAGVQFLVDGVNVGAEDTTAPYSVGWDTTAAADGPHTVAAIARDAFGRTTTSATVSVTVTNATATLVRVEDNSSSIAYAGSWALGNTAKAWSAGTAALATGGPLATGEATRATLTFTGTAAKWIGFRGPQTGIARVYLDGTLVATVDCYAAAEAVEAVLYEVSGLTAATHTLVVESTGTKNPASSDIFVVVDAFDVTTATATEPPADPPPAATRYEDLDSAIVYTAGSAASAPPNWWHGSRSRGWSGETSSFNRSEGARATFTFTGTSVTWIGFRANWAGIARVFVDGVFVTELDLYSPTEQPQAPVFTASGLAAGTHTITIEATGRRNASAVDNAVVVDGFEVSPAAAPGVVGARIEESAAAVTLAGAWTAASAHQAWSGGAASMSSTIGARATVTFTGNSVSLIGMRGPRHGIARVYLDGAFHATVDTFAAADIQTVIFTETNLAQGTHELTIEVTGLKNAAATDHRVVVDAFDVRTLLEEVDPSVAYSGTWSAQNFDEKWSGTSPNYGSGSATRSATAGARAELRFFGTGARWIGFRGPAAGIARVYVDGVFAAEIDAYAATKQVQSEMFSIGGLAAGVHTIAIEVTGLRNAFATNAFIVVDAFEVTLPSSMPDVARAPQTDASYPVGPWEQSFPNPLFTGTTIAHSSAAGAKAEFTFTGTGIRWVGQRGFANGIARVYLDGVHVADVDSFAPIQEEFQAAMFSVSGLAAGTHTLSIELLGTSHAAAAGTRIVIDAFDVIR